MTGEVGTGKTTLLRAVLSTFDKTRLSSIFLFNSRLDFQDFVEFVFDEYHIPIQRPTKAMMLLQLHRWLMARYSENHLCVIVVDEAQHLSSSVMEEIRLLTNMETPSAKLLQVVLSGQPELEDKLMDHSVRQLLQRVAVWCRTQPLTTEQTPIYIAERLRIAGSREPLFSPEAIKLVHKYSKGIPRLINVICEHALICAFAGQTKFISPEIIESVATAMNLKQHPPAIREQFYQEA
jgi:type II secretory pathway predicted ATPase ExeA